MSAQTCTVTIGGVTKSVEQLRASLVLNGVGEASFDTIATGAAYVPSDGDAVVITLGGSTRSAAIYGTAIALALHLILAALPKDE